MYASTQIFAFVCSFFARPGEKELGLSLVGYVQPLVAQRAPAFLPSRGQKRHPI